MVTVSVGWKTGGCGHLDERVGQRTLGEAGHLAEHLLGGVHIQIDELLLTQGFVDAEDFEQVEDLVADIALVVAHYSSLRRERHLNAIVRQVGD